MYKYICNEVVRLEELLIHTDIFSWLVTLYSESDVSLGIPN